MKRFPKGKIIYCIAFFLILCTAGVMMASVSGFSIESIFSTAKSKGYNDAIFERNGEICWFDYSEGSITILDRGGKYTPVLSPNRSRILYRKSVFETEGNVMQFGIITIDGEFLREIVIDSYLSNDIIGLQWLSDSTVGITTHVNPSTAEFFVYNVDTGEKIASYVGYAFAQIPNTDKIIHAENVPHWSDEPVYHSFVVDGKIVYTSDIIDARLDPPVFSSDGTKFAFVENLPDLEASQRIITGNFDKESLTLKNIRSINIPSEVAGYLTFDESNNICIINNNLLQIYNEKASKFITSEISTDLRNRWSDSKNFAALQTAVTKYWGDDSLERINSITWIPEVKTEQP